MDRFAVREVCLNLQCKPWQFCAMCALTLAGAVLLFSLPSPGAQTQPATQSLDGLWLTDGYGDLIEFQGDNARGYQITTLSCISAAKATRKTEGGTVNQVVFAGD